MADILAGIIAAALTAGTVIALAALGEVLAERTGVYNLGLDGIMGMGGVIAILTVSSLRLDPYMGLLAAMGIGLVFGLIFAIVVVAFRADQVLCGMALAFLGKGLSNLIGDPFAGQPAASQLGRNPIAFLKDIPVIGNAIFNQNVLVYLAFLGIPAVIAFLLYRTRHGISIRATGENPVAADSTGIPVNRLRFLYTCLGGALGGLGGAYLTLGYTPMWLQGVTGGRGWIAIALVIFSGWRPWGIVAGALLFGGIMSLGFVVQAQGWGIPPAFLSMIPYLSTVAIILLPNLFRRGRRKLSAAPDNLGVPFFREGS